VQQPAQEDLNMTDHSFFAALAAMQQAESRRDPVRSFLWWIVKTIAWLVLWVVVTGLTVVSCIGAWAGSTKVASLFGIVIIIMFVLSHFIWMGKPGRGR